MKKSLFLLILSLSFISLSFAEKPIETSFEILSDFSITSGDAKELDEQIPESIKALDGKLVTLEGYMAPSEMKKNISKFMLLLQPFGCCAKMAPDVNEWIDVTMKGKPTRYVPDEIVRVRGVLSVQGKVTQNGVSNIYHIFADQVEIVE